MRKGDQTRAAIVSEAMAMASVQGLEGLSIGQLAAKVGMSKSGLFGHFGSKHALQLAVLEEIVERFINEVIRPALMLPTGEGRLRTLIENWLRWDTHGVPSGGCPLTAAANELDAQPGQLRDYIAKQQRDWLDCIQRIVRKSVKEGQFRADLDVEQVAFEIHGIGLAHHLTAWLLSDSKARERALTALERVIDNARAKSIH